MNLLVSEITLEYFDRLSKRESTYFKMVSFLTMKAIMLFLLRKLILKLMLLVIGRLQQYIGRLQQYRDMKLFMESQTRLESAKDYLAKELSIAKPKY